LILYYEDHKTIDELHNEHLEEFKKNREGLPSKKKKLSFMAKTINGQ
jgi:hypothetical protein